jgi:hypothetical protein
LVPPVAPLGSHFSSLISFPARDFLCRHVLSPASCSFPAVSFRLQHRISSHSSSRMYFLFPSISFFTGFSLGSVHH